MRDLPRAIEKSGEPNIPPLTERRASHDGKRNVPEHPASVFARKEADALNGARVGATVATRQDLDLPGGGSGTNSSTYT